MFKSSGTTFNYTLILFLVGAFFVFFESGTDYWDLSYIAKRSQEETTPFFDILQFNSIGWLPWFLTGLLFLKEISLINLISTTKKSALLLSAKIVGQILLTVALAGLLFALMSEEQNLSNYFETTSYLLVTNFYKYLLALLVAFTITLLIEAKNKHTTFSDTIERLKQEKEHIKQTLEENEEKKLEKLSIKVGNRIKVVPVSQITWIEADDYCVKIHTGEKYYTLRDSLKSMEKKLSDDFIRVHRGAIVNLDHLESIRTNNSSSLAILNTGEKVAVARTRIPGIKKQLKTL